MESIVVIAMVELSPLCGVKCILNYKDNFNSCQGYNKQTNDTQVFWSVY